jgi:L-arabinose isomerase
VSANAFNGVGIKYKIINGLLGLDKTIEISVTDENTAKRKETIRAWKEIGEWAQATTVKRTLQHSYFGFLGNNYSEKLLLLKLREKWNRYRSFSRS